MFLHCTSVIALKHCRAITGALARRTCNEFLGQAITTSDTVNSGQGDPQKLEKSKIANKKVFGEKGVNSSRQARKVLQKRTRGIEEKGRKEGQRERWG